MVVHFDTRQLALDHLQENGWKQIQNGRFVSRDGSCSADITPAFGTVVRVFFQEIQAA